jgi:hypothetical protein
MRTSPRFSDLLLGGQDDVLGGKAKFLLPFFKRRNCLREPELREPELPRIGFLG